MNEQAQELLELMLQTDQEFHQLAVKHHELEGRFHQLAEKPYLSEPEQFEKSELEEAQAAAQGPDGRHLSQPAPAPKPRVSNVRPVVTAAWVGTGE